MASLIWVSVFCLLCVEVALCFLAMIPLPHKAWKKISSFLKISSLQSSLTFVVRFLVLGLALGVFDSIKTISSLQENLSVAEPNDIYSAAQISQKKQRVFRAERNMYLAGFCLALIFIIKRLVELAVNNADLYEQLMGTGSQPAGSSTSSASAADTSSTPAAPSSTTDNNSTASSSQTPYQAPDGVPRQRQGYAAS